MGATNKWILTAISLIISGCNLTPPANANTIASSQADHVMTFNVRAGVQAKVSLQETRIMVQTNHLPAIQVSSVNLPLLREWSRIYFKINDYDRDGMNDLAILQTVGRVGTQRCYGIYRFNPATGQFRQKKSFDRCGI